MTINPLEESDDSKKWLEELQKAPILNKTNTSFRVEKLEDRIGSISKSVGIEVTLVCTECDGIIFPRQFLPAEPNEEIKVLFACPICCWGTILERNFTGSESGEGYSIRLDPNTHRSKCKEKEGTAPEIQDGVNFTPLDLSDHDCEEQKKRNRSYFLNGSKDTSRNSSNT